MKKQKINLKAIQVESFTTTTQPRDILGGGTGSCYCTIVSACNLCPGSQEGTVCCPPKK